MNPRRSGRPPKPEVRERILELVRKGWLQREIADKLGMARTTVRYHLDVAGYPKEERHTASPIHDGKRRCRECRRVKTLGAFASRYDSRCCACIRKPKPTPYS
jgi:orotate phosphoribosyltransferase-like protein